MERLTNLIDVAYTIDNFDKKLSISVIFSAFAHLGKYEKNIHHFGEKPAEWSG